jgi:hypothetical protein
MEEEEEEEEEDGEGREQLLGRGAVDDGCMHTH